MNDDDSYARQSAEEAASDLQLRIDRHQNEYLQKKKTVPSFRSKDTMESLSGRSSDFDLIFAKDFSVVHNPRAKFSIKELHQLKRQMSNFKYIDHDEIIRNMGGSFSRFHILAYMMCLTLFSTEGFLIYNLSYLTLEPKYMCVNSEGVAQQCKRADTCKAEFNNDFSKKYAADPKAADQFRSGFYIHEDENNIVLDNWMIDLDLRCAEKWKIGMFGSNFFIGNVIGSTILSSYGDTIGRIPLIKVSQGLTLLSYSYIVYFTRDDITIYSLFFLIGLLSCWRLSLGYIYGMEIISETRSNISGSLFNLFDATTVIFSSMFLLYVSQSWVSLHSFYIALITLSLVISLILPESPKFLVSRKQYVQAAVSYNFIASMNRSTFHLLDSVHRFKDQKSGDKKALKRHFKRTQYDISRGLGLDQPPIRKISEDEREYLSDSDVDDSKEEEQDVRQTSNVSYKSNRSDDF